MRRWRLKARWIVPVAGEPVENGLMAVEDGRIVSLSRGAVHEPCDADYGDAVILPGFVNAHTHLDLTAFGGCVPYLGSFTDWIRILVSMQTAEGAEARMDRGVADGLQQSLAAGVTCVADIGCGERAVQAWSTAALHVVGFFEAIGMGPRRFDVHPRSLRRGVGLCEALQAARAGKASCAQSRRTFIPSISPHAPYSTAPEVYREAIAFCRERGLPVCTHLAETREETEFLARGTGPFRTLLEHRGLWDGSFVPPGCSPAEYAETLGLLACRPLLAHVNYVSESDIDLLARRQCSVVYCPRTHRFFEHAPHAYGRMLARALNVCVGTDSLASAPSLSILEELRFLRQIDADLPDDVLLEMGTLRGARALGLDDRLGSLEPGKHADFVVLPMDRRDARPLEALLRSEAQPSHIWLAGTPA